MSVIERGLLTESDLPGPSWSRMAVAGLSQTLTPAADPTLGPEHLGPERLGPERLGPERLGPERLGPERLGPERLGPERLGPERREITLTVSRTLHSHPWFYPTLEPTRGVSLPWRRLEWLWSAKATHESAVKRAVAVLDAVCPAGPEPWVVPTSDGGVQIEWASSGFEIEIEIFPSGPAQILIVEPSGEESEMPASADSTEIWSQLHDRIAAMGRSTA